VLGVVCRWPSAIGWGLMSSPSRLKPAPGMAFERAQLISGSQVVAPHIIRFTGQLDADERVLERACDAAI
jgi:hypothetical protein